MLGSGANGVVMSQVELFPEDDHYTLMSFGLPVVDPMTSRLATVAVSDTPVSPVKTFIKDPQATLDYWVDWDAVLRDEDNVLDPVLMSWWITPAGITVETEPPETFVGTRAVVWVSVGTVGARYDLVNRVLTQAGRVDERTIRIKIKEL